MILIILEILELAGRKEALRLQSPSGSAKEESVARSRNFCGQDGQIKLAKMAGSSWKTWPDQEDWWQRWPDKVGQDGQIKLAKMDRSSWP
jgi:hypothetical protein